MKGPGPGIRSFSRLLKAAGAIPPQRRHSHPFFLLTVPARAPAQPVVRHDLLFHVCPEQCIGPMHPPPSYREGRKSWCSLKGGVIYPDMSWMTDLNSCHQSSKINSATGDLDRPPAGTGLLSPLFLDKAKKSPHLPTPGTSLFTCPHSQTAGLTWWLSSGSLPVCLEGLPSPGTEHSESSVPSQRGRCPSCGLCSAGPNGRVASESPLVLLPTWAPPEPLSEGEEPQKLPHILSLTQRSPESFSGAETAGRMRRKWEAGQGGNHRLALFSLLLQRKNAIGHR